MPLSPRSSPLPPPEQGRFPQGDRGENSFQSQAEGSAARDATPGLPRVAGWLLTQLVEEASRQGSRSWVPLAQLGGADPTSSDGPAASGGWKLAQVIGKPGAHRTPGRGSVSRARGIREDPLPAGAPTAPPETGPQGVFATVKKGIRRTQAKRQLGRSISESQAGIRKDDEIGANRKQTNQPRTAGKAETAQPASWAIRLDLCWARGREPALSGCVGYDIWFYQGYCLVIPRASVFRKHT